MRQDLVERRRHRLAPPDLPAVRPAPGADGQADTVPGEVDQHLADAAPPLERVEDQPDGGPHLLVGVDIDHLERIAAEDLCGLDVAALRPVYDLD